MGPLRPGRARAGVNPLRDRRLWEVRRLLHTRNLDVGAGAYPVTPDSVTVDSQPGKHPDFEADLARGLPFPDGSFDSVTLLEVLEHFHAADQAGVLAEAARVLEPGGQLVLTTPYSRAHWRAIQRVMWFVRSRTTQSEYYRNGHTHGHVGLLDPSQIAGLVRGAGLRVDRERRVMLYTYMVVARKPAAFL